MCGTLNLEHTSFRQIHHSVPPRRLIYRAGEATDDFDVICEGWAACVMRLADGRRQILSFLIPGDLVSVTALFKGRQPFSVQSLSEVRYCLYNRFELQKTLKENAKVFEEIVKIGIVEKELADQTVVSLGRKSAAARIARLILLLMERLKVRGAIQDMSFGFPLRQQHIADAMGLTTVHVSRVINALRKDGLVDISQRKINILNLAGLQSVAEER